MENFIRTYKNLDKDTLDSLADIYTPEISFTDPAHEIHGLEQLRKYFFNLYENITTIDFHFLHHLRVASDGYLQWEMNFSHPRLNKGEIIGVAGVTYIHFASNNKVDIHRDYFDLGAMLYEHLPLLGGIVTSLKRRLGS